MSTTTHTIRAEPPPELSPIALLAELQRRGVSVRAGRDPQAPAYRTLEIAPAHAAADLRNAIDLHFAELHRLIEQAADEGSRSA